MDSWIYRYEKPETMLTEERILKWIYQRGDRKFWKQEFNSLYQRQSNGLFERIIRTVRDMMTTSLKGKFDEINWFELLIVLNKAQPSSLYMKLFLHEKINLHAIFKNELTERKVTKEVKLNLNKAANEMKLFELN